MAENSPTLNIHVVCSTVELVPICRTARGIIPKDSEPPIRYLEGRNQQQLE